MSTPEPQIKPLSREKYGLLTPIAPIGGGKYWSCLCRCGTTTKASRWHLENDRRRSCGCRRQEREDETVCTKCGQPGGKDDFYWREDGTLHLKQCKTCVRRRTSTTCRIRHAKLRLAALVAYGGEHPRCACPGCDVDVLEFLHIDHGKGDGAKHRREMKSLNLYRWLARENYPRDLGLRVLCANCNLAIGAYGYCPHERQ